MEEKLKTLIHYIVSKSKKPMAYREILDVLWMADCEHFKRTEESLSGVAWVKGKHGPEPSQASLPSR